jgi:hypothetical protein
VLPTGACPTTEAKQIILSRTFRNLTAFHADKAITAHHKAGKHQTPNTMTTHRHTYSEMDIDRARDIKKRLFVLCDGT